ncbi:hypothetical protein V8D89_007194 [Ganoderma adspersum]
MCTTHASALLAHDAAEGTNSTPFGPLSVTTNASAFDKVLDHSIMPKPATKLTKPTTAIATTQAQTSTTTSTVPVTTSETTTTTTVPPTPASTATTMPTATTTTMATPQCMPTTTMTTVPRMAPTITTATTAMQSTPASSTTTALMPTTTTTTVPTMTTAPGMAPTMTTATTATQPTPVSTTTTAPTATTTTTALPTTTMTTELRTPTSTVTTAPRIATNAATIDTVLATMSPTAATTRLSTAAFTTTTMPMATTEATVLTAATTTAPATRETTAPSTMTAPATRGTTAPSTTAASAQISVNINDSTAMHSIPAGPDPLLMQPTSTLSCFTDDPAFSAVLGFTAGALPPGAAQLAVKLNNVCAVTAEWDFYGASGTDTIKQLTWIPTRSGSVLVDKAIGLTTMECWASHATDPILNPKPPTPELAPVYIIGNIASLCCFLQSDGNYQPPEKRTRSFNVPFSKSTLACALIAPPDEYPILQQDYTRALETVSALVKHFRPACSGTTFNHKDMKVKHLRLRHKIFQEKASKDDIDPTADLPAKFQLATWPVNDTIQTHLDALVNTHFTRPLPAFDINANLIPPSSYVDELHGTTVLAGFHAIEFHISGKHNVCLEIQYMCILIPPTGGDLHIGSKQTALQMTDPFTRTCDKWCAV